MPQFSSLLPSFEGDAALSQVLESVDQGISGCAVAPAGARIPLIASMAARRGGTTYVVTPTGREAEETALALRAWIDEVEVFPSWETLPHDRLQRTPWRNASRSCGALFTRNLAMNTREVSMLL